MFNIFEYIIIQYFIFHNNITKYSIYLIFLDNNFSVIVLDPRCKLTWFADNAKQYPAKLQNEYKKYAYE